MARFDVHATAGRNAQGTLWRYRAVILASIITMRHIATR